jgi:DNA-directed RNA polymerase specialized sigma24 family protein
MNGTVEPGPLITTSMQPRKDASPFDEDAPRRADRLARRIRAAEAGDHRAVRTLLAEVGPAVCRVVTFVLGPGHPDTADLIQDSLTEFLRALPPPDDAPQLEHLAASIALRRALEAAQWPALSVSAGPLGQVRWLGGFWRTSPQQMQAQRRRRLVAGALLSLSDEEAEVLGLRLLVGLTLPQIAALTGLPGAEVRSLLRAAKVILGAPGAGASPIPLHPEALRDLQRTDRLELAEQEQLAAHETQCPACALEGELALDFARAARTSVSGVKLGQAIDAATAHWVWTVSRRVLVSRRQRRWTWAALGALITLSALLAGALWSRSHTPPPDLALPADLAEPTTPEL